MDKSFYEQMLLNNYKGADGAEENWDARAKHFNMAQQKDRSGFAEKVVAILEERNLLAGASILDIGGGSGRYAVPFAARAKHVTITDISSNMLELAQSNAQQEGLTNLSYIKTEWVGTDLSDLKWNKQFDLAFASMCPAIRSPEGLRNMMESSRGFCLINQFVYSTDSLSDYLMKTLDMKHSYNPHNDRDTVQAVFNLLWMEGYEPEITYLRQGEENSYTVEEAFEQYASRYNQAAQSKGLELQSLIWEYAKQEVIQVSSKTTLAMILWKV